MRPITRTMEAAAHPWPALGALLLRDGALSVEQLEQTLREKAPGVRLGEALVERGYVTPTQVSRVLAEQHELPFVDLVREPIDMGAAGLLSESLARRYGAIPVRFLEDGSVLVALDDPTNVVAADDLRIALGATVRVGVASSEAIKNAIGRIYSDDLELEEEDEPAFAGPVATVIDLREAAAHAPAIKRVNAVLSRAIELGASDVHFTPQRTRLLVRARVDGVMRELTTIPKNLQPAITSRLKVMAELDIAEKRAPQDGRVALRSGDRSIDLRVAVLPTTHGEKVTLRIMGSGSDPLSLEELGMSEPAAAALASAVGQPFGAVIVVGPTGSGKSTTLHAALTLLNDDERVITTIEDPVEYHVPNADQIEVNPRAGLTFASGLRTILRSDPDVILVGEIRDEETADIAFQAAMTGHMVLTSLHAQNAASAIARLKDMGVEPSLIATSLTCIVAQRLARKLCAHCRESYLPEPAELIELGLPEDDSTTWLYRAAGCEACSFTGYAGRVGLFEVMPIRGEIRRLVERSTEEIFAAAVEAGMMTMREDGIRLVLAGVTSLPELRRITGDRTT